MRRRRRVQAGLGPLPAGQRQNKRVNERLRQFLLQAVGLAAIGTVADVVPLIDENRILVRHGLQQPAGVSDRRRRRAAAADEAARQARSSTARTSPSPSARGSTPPAGSARRRSASSCSRPTATQRAEKLAQYIDELNAQRQTLERSMSRAAEKQAREQFDPRRDAALVLADDEWHAGVIGIVAGRLADKHHLPTVVVALDPLGVKPGIGSARSVPGFNLHAALAECGEHCSKATAATPRRRG